MKQYSSFYKWRIQVLFSLLLFIVFSCVLLTYDYCGVLNELQFKILNILLVIDGFWLMKLLVYDFT